MLAYGCILIMAIIAVSSFYHYETRSDNEKMIEQLRYHDSRTSKVEEIQYEHVKGKSTNIVLENEDVMQLGRNSKNLTTKDISKGDKVEYKSFKNKQYIVDVK